MNSGPSPDADERWVAVSVEPSANSQRVIDALFDAGCAGLVEDGPSVIAHYPPGTIVTDIEAAVAAVDPRARVTTSYTPSISAAQAHGSVREHTVGQVRIGPPWMPGTEPDLIHVTIEPAMAFGTGEHATTRGALRLIQSLPRIPNMVADIGAGSAVLAIAAAKLGAQRVVAIELDSDAIGNAEENVRSNGVEGLVHVIEGDAAVLLPFFAPVGLVLANIISSILLDLLPLIHDSLSAGGNAVLAGILIEERTAMLDAIERGGWSLLSEDSEEGWWSVLIERRK